MNSYKVIQCPKCGQVQVSGSKVLQCKYCGKSTALVGKSGEMRVKVVANFGSPQEAAVFIREYKEKKAGK